MSSIGIDVRATTCLGHLMHRLPTAACRDMGSSGAASDFGLRRMFGYPAHGHIVDVRFDPIAYLGFRGVFDYQVLASDFVLSKYVTFDSRQVESGDQIFRTSQRVESDATPHWVETLDHTVSFEIPADVTQIRNRVDLDAYDRLIDSSTADRYSLDMAIGSSQVEMFGFFQFEAIGGAISRKLDRDIGEGL
ncbi:uncharacterized protein A4U43_C04F5620 [Asparagus officinalis]|uniref:Uncharacterized protein n=1 Tax=Asparagus officinalis TaxID=4686 RepID=A0A5P1F305_ASPOF|nr:uncharacterized protein A4U43_C04F5620 [Asparagus officinalis]